jgi:hypothetical protein
MPDSEQLSIIKNGGDAWNAWRNANPRAKIDLRGADLQGHDLVQVNLSFADLSDAQLSGANLTQADLSHCRLHSANLSGANLTRANLSDAVLDSAAVFRADMTAATAVRSSFRSTMLVLSNFTLANLTGADLANANLLNTLFIRTRLQRARMPESRLEWTVFVDVDLSEVIGLDDVVHNGPSSLGMDTIMRSAGQIPEQFLRGAGLKDVWIQHVRALRVESSRFSSCFISYATADQPFADRLYDDLQRNGVRCWLAHRDIRAGRKIHQQIEEAIRTSDRLLLIISESSMKREWVNTEIIHAREYEARQNRQMLFPITLVPFDRITGWSVPDPVTGKDAAREIREYFILDFSNWRNDTEYQRSFNRLLEGLRTEDSRS